MNDILDKIKDKITEFFDKLNIHEFEDVFPINKMNSSLESMVKVVGIYIGALIVVGLLILILGGIPVLGVLIWIISSIVALYCIVGIIEALLKFMKYN